jgi:hypothetical protein
MTLKRTSLKKASCLVALALVANLVTLMPAQAAPDPLGENEYAIWLEDISEQLFGPGANFGTDNWYLDETVEAVGIDYQGHTAAGLPFTLTAFEIVDEVVGRDHEGHHVTHRFLLAELLTPLGTVLIDILDTTFEEIGTGVTTDALLPAGLAGTLSGGNTALLMSMNDQVPAEQEEVEEKDPCQDCKDAYNKEVKASQKRLKKNLRNCAVGLIGGVAGALAAALCAGFASGDAADEISAAVGVYCACMKKNECELPEEGPPCKDE